MSAACIIIFMTRLVRCMSLHMGSILSFS
uniref:Uncharacterized protein n=1 Tax=Arundo donax TaxID=35708 RepID=A0A0A9BYQ4_ARUDO